MDAILIMGVAFIGYIVAYHTYGRFLARKVFGLSDSLQTPAEKNSDGVDYVPTRKGIIFGHHYTSIAGTGPIVGPALGIIWGWLPALLWVFFGSIFMGAVHDFGALVISLRNDGKSLSKCADQLLGPGVRRILFAIVFLVLLIVIAIFCWVVAIIFTWYPHSVFPVWMGIPIALVLGWAVYRKGANLALSTGIAVFLLYVYMVLGDGFELKMPAIAGLPAGGVWSIVLLIYCFIAASLPVTVLLQPRDYINAWQLFVAMGLLVLGAVGAGLFGEPRLEIVAPAVNLHPPDAPGMWPVLFITIACGAISGFHSLVASGTTSKQVRRETDALFVGYGSMLLEAALATLVIIAVAAGIGMYYECPDGQVLTGVAAWNHHYSSWKASAGLASKLASVVVGSANMLTILHIPRSIGKIIMGVFIASFAGTTLDTATRLQRYIISETLSGTRLSFLSGRRTATALAVVTAGILAFSTGRDGTGALVLWPMFGATNQLLAGLALLLITVYLRKRGGKWFMLSLVPCIIMLTITLWALVSNEIGFVKGVLARHGAREIILSIVNGAALLLSVWMIVESVKVLLRRRGTA